MYENVVLKAWFASFDSTFVFRYFASVKIDWFVLKKEQKKILDDFVYYNKHPA